MNNPSLPDRSESTSATPVSPLPPSSTKGKRAEAECGFCDNGVDEFRHPQSRISSYEPCPYCRGAS